MPAKLKRACGCSGDCSLSCSVTCCISGEASGSGSGTDENGPCVDFLSAVTTSGAQVTGLYNCSGGVDDQGTWTWSGGSKFRPASGPGPCYGAGSISWVAALNKGARMRCRAGSWGGNVGCSMNCCLQEAP
jgi:hypothetical protein